MKTMACRQQMQIIRGGRPQKKKKIGSCSTRLEGKIGDYVYIYGKKSFIIKVVKVGRMRCSAAKSSRGHGDAHQEHLHTDVGSKQWTQSLINFKIICIFIYFILNEMLLVNFSMVSTSTRLLCTHKLVLDKTPTHSQISNRSILTIPLNTHSCSPHIWHCVFVFEKLSIPPISHLPYNLLFNLLHHSLLINWIVENIFLHASYYY